MTQTSNSGNFEGVLLDRKTFYQYVNLGRVAGDRLAEKANAKRQIGRRVLIYRPAIDEYLRSQAKG